MRPCHNKLCGELHGYSWTRPYEAAPHRMVEEPEIWCCYVCAAYDRAWSARAGWNQEVVDRIKKELNDQ